MLGLSRADKDDDRVCVACTRIDLTWTRTKYRRFHFFQTVLPIAYKYLKQKSNDKHSSSIKDVDNQVFKYSVCVGKYYFTDIILILDVEQM